MKFIKIEEKDDFEIYINIASISKIQFLNKVEGDETFPNVKIWEKGNDEPQEFWGISQKTMNSLLHLVE